MSEVFKYDRRHFLGTAAFTIAATQLGILGSTHTQIINISPAESPTTKLRTISSLGTLKQINAGVLNVGYAGAGPASGPPVMLLHGLLKVMRMAHRIRLKAPMRINFLESIYTKSLQEGLGTICPRRLQRLSRMLSLKWKVSPGECVS